MAERPLTTVAPVAPVAPTSHSGRDHGRGVESHLCLAPVSRSGATPAPSLAMLAMGTLHNVMIFHGAGTQDTPTFTIHKNAWRIAGSTHASQRGETLDLFSGTFDVDIRREGGAYQQVAVNTVGDNTGPTVVHDSGTFYLDINTAQPYVISIAEYW